jgi:hypothetical protein
MRDAILILALSIAAPAFARDEYRRDFAKTVPLAAGRILHLETSNGNVIIHAQPRGDVAIRATIRVNADSDAEAKSFGDRIEIVVQETGGVSVRTEYPKTWTTHRNLGYSVEYDISMPDAAVLDIRNRFGAVSVTDPHAGGAIHNSNGKVSLWGGRGRLEIENSFGGVDVRTNEGDLLVRNNNGEVTATDVRGSVDITNRFAPVRVTNAGRGVAIHSQNGQVSVTKAGGTTSVSNSFGPVEVADVTTGDLTVQAQNSEVTATNVAGSATLHTTFGKVNFSRIGKVLTVTAGNSSIAGDTVGGNASIATTFGSIEVRGIKGGARVDSANNTNVRMTGIGGEAYVKTTFGGVTLTDVAGPITVENQNGSVTVEARPGQHCEPISLHTSFGPIRVTVPAGIGYNVNAHTTFGRIRSDAELTVSGALGPDSVTGKIAGGGCDLRLMNQNNGIDILNGRR